MHFLNIYSGVYTKSYVGLLAYHSDPKYKDPLYINIEYKISLSFGTEGYFAVAVTYSTIHAYIHICRLQNPMGSVLRGTYHFKCALGELTSTGEQP